MAGAGNERPPLPMEPPLEDGHTHLCCTNGAMTSSGMSEYSVCPKLASLRRISAGDIRYDRCHPPLIILFMLAASPVLRT